MRVHAVITAAGSSSRMAGVDKLLLSLRGRPLIVRTVETFIDYPRIGSVVVTVNPERVTEFEAIFAEHFPESKRPYVVAGGYHRQESILFGLRRLATALETIESQTVMIHDGARPFITHELFERLLGMLDEFDGAVPTLPVRDTVKLVEGRRVVGTQDRETLRLVQTPQVFKFDEISKLHERAHSEGFVGTDDASLLERFGGQVGWTEGPSYNLKITVPDDVKMLESLFESRTESALP